MVRQSIKKEKWPVGEFGASREKITCPLLEYLPFFIANSVH